MKGLLAAEWFKVRKRRLPWLLAASLVVIIGLLYAMMFLAASATGGDETFAAELRNSLRVENTVRFADGIVYRVVALLGVIFAALVVADDYRWRTVVTQATWTGRRGRPFLASVAVGALLAAGGLVLGYLVTAVVVIAGNAAQGTLEGGDAGWWLARDAALAAVRTLPAVLFFVVLAAGVAAWTKSAAAGIGLPLAALFLEPLGTAAIVASGVASGLGQLLLSRNVDALLAANGAVRGADETLPAGLPPAWQAAVLLLGYGGLTCALVARMVSRRELPD